MSRFITGKREREIIEQITSRRFSNNQTMDVNSLLCDAHEQAVIDIEYDQSTFKQEEWNYNTVSNVR